MAKKNQEAATRGASRDRVSAAYSVLRQAIINVMAAEGERTADIADALKVNRSYVIRLTDFTLKPTNAAERAVRKLADTYEAKLRKMGMAFAFGEGFETTLAGDDGRRGKGGGRPRKDAAPVKATKPKATKPKAAPAKAPKAPKATKPKAAPAKAPAKKTKPAPTVAKKGAGAEKVAEARAAKRAASRAPKATPKATPESAPPAPDTSLDDALKSVGVGD